MMRSLMLAAASSLAVLAMLLEPTTAFSASPSSPFYASTNAKDTTPLPPRVIFENLDAASFRHPLDRNLTHLVQKLPGIGLAERGIRRAFPLVEQGVRLDLLSSAVQVSPQQLPQIHQLLVEACQIMELDTTSIPELYIQSNAQANAYTLAFQGKDAPPIVVVTSALLDRCTNAELQAIIGHELGHVKCEHSLYLTLGGLASTPLRNLPLTGQRVDKALQQWRLAAEYTCDRAALLVTQDVSVVNSALIKLVSGTSTVQVDTDEFVKQAQAYDDLLQSANPLVKASIRRQVRTHPLPVRRVVQLQKWAESKEYLDLLAERRVEMEMTEAEEEAEAKEEEETGLEDEEP